jgi:hypoxanthine phosphoribosyltransferase
MRCELISWQEVQRLCLELARQLRASGYQPDRVIAIARGGLIPARLVCDHLDFQVLDSIRVQHYLAGASRQPEATLSYPFCTDITGLRILLVDDVNDSGDSLEVAVSYLQGLHPGEIRTAVMHQKTSTHFPIDYYAKKIVKWRWLIYPWAVHEDISGFLRRSSSSPESVIQAREFLLDEFGIRLSDRRLKTILEFMG